MVKNKSLQKIILKPGTYHIYIYSLQVITSGCVLYIFVRELYTGHRKGRIKIWQKRKIDFRKPVKNILVWSRENVYPQTVRNRNAERNWESEMGSEESKSERKRKKIEEGKRRIDTGMILFGTRRKSMTEGV